MAFAKYFNRDVVALNKRLSLGADRNFKATIERQLISLEFDEQVQDSKEASVCLELLVRLISRFYPKLKFEARFRGADDHIQRLQELARSINSNIEFAGFHEAPTIVIVAAKTPVLTRNCPQLFVGSEGWIAKVSRNKVLSFGQSENPFGASIAACIACSNLFRHVFEHELRLPLDGDVGFCTHCFALDNHQGHQHLGPVALDDVNIVGSGAIGSSCVWALSKVPDLSGKIRLIDHDQVEESNLQRYILFGESDIGNWKVDSACAVLERDGLQVEPLKMRWDQFVSERQSGDCRCRLAVVSIDSKEGRVDVQSSLPFKILNAYTDESRFGISRHLDFATSTCLACLYIPTAVQRSKLQVMAEELNMVGNEVLLYQYSKEGKLLDETFLNAFCSRNGIQLVDVNEYKLRTLGDFYVEMVCGYKMIKMASNSGKVGESVDVPLSFQSAMAGIMLALEIVFESAGFARGLSQRNVSQWQVLDLINDENPSSFSYLKNSIGNCICGDADYQLAFTSKWRSAVR
jgi:hypothetical protein